MKNIQVVKKEITSFGNTLIIEYEKEGKKEKREIEGIAIEIIEVLCVALMKQLPEGYKTEEQLRKK